MLAAAKYKWRILNQLQVMRSINAKDGGSIPSRCYPTKVGSVNVETYEANSLLVCLHWIVFRKQCKARLGYENIAFAAIWKY